MKLLPVVSSTCNRRQLLLRVGLGALLAACRTSLDDELPPITPVEPPAPGEPLPGATRCEEGVCLDLSHPDNVALIEVDGFRVLQVETRRVIVVRTSEDTFIALSAACTHAGTTVRYDPSRGDLVCPNHGSRFSLEGDATVGPAVTSLSTFPTTFDPVTDTLVIEV
jgi:cytochrome b6-f complex iron-sulfur subunit